MRRTVPALLTTSALLLAAHGEADAVCTRTPRNLRIMSWQVNCNSGTLSMEDVFQQDVLDRMSAVVAEIDKWKPDVVALYGVQGDMECKDSILEFIGDDYPARIEEIDDNSLWEDSGLMLLSKVPFTQFPTDVYFNNTDFETNGVNFGATWDEQNSTDQYRTIAIHAYTGSQCKGQDCYYERAAAMVRLDAGLGGAPCPVNVVFTQPVTIQEDDDLDERTERMGMQWDSMVAIRNMIVGSLTNTQLRTEPLFVMGDLGVDGNIGPDGDIKGMDDPDHHPLRWPEGPPDNLWERMFDPFHIDADLVASGFFACGAAGLDGSDGCQFNGTTVTHLLTDTAAFEHPRTDLFQTKGSPPSNPDFLDGELDDEDIVNFNFADGSGFRFDYILHNHPRGTAPPFAALPFVCPQHLRRDLSHGPDGMMSDHAPVILDVGTMTSQCKPLPTGPGASKTLAFGSGPSDQSWTSSFGYRGNVQWFFINQKGTYSITASGLNRVTVFSKTDLSVPKSDIGGVTSTWTDTATGNRVTGPVFDFDDPPYFIKVEAAPGTAVFPAPYTFFIHKHGCTNPINDFCVLKAGDQTAMAWPSGSLVSYPIPGSSAVPYYQDQAYFQFGVGESAQGEVPEIDFRVFRSSSLAPLSPEDAAAGQGAKIFRSSSYDFTRCDCNSPDNNAHCAPAANGCNTTIPIPTWDPWAASAPSGQVRDGHTFNATGGALFTDTPNTRERHILRITRSSLAEFDMAVTYLTNLTTIRSTDVSCEIQNDSFGDDDIWVQVMSDDSPLLICTESALVHALGEFDSGTGGTDKSGLLAPMAFLRTFQPNFCEDDAGANGNEDLLAPLGSNVIVPHALDVSTPVPGGLIFADEQDADDRDYSYHYGFTMIHDDETLVLQ
jgi:hypothetical protein